MGVDNRPAWMKDQQVSQENSVGANGSAPRTGFGSYSGIENASYDARYQSTSTRDEYASSKYSNNHPYPRYPEEDRKYDRYPLSRDGMNRYPSTSNSVPRNSSSN